MDKAKAILANRTMKDLLALWDMSSRQPHRANNATVRGWITDEIQRRMPEQFDAWLDSDYNTDESLHLFIKA